MATQFIVRSEGGLLPLNLKTVVFDGFKIGRLQENGIRIFEMPSDPDVIIELVVKRRSSSAAAAGSSPNPIPNSSQKRDAPAFTPDDILMKRYSAEEISYVISKKQRLEGPPNTKAVRPSTIAAANERWQEQYDKLVTFKQENGHCRVPCRYKDDPDLGGWVKFQREKYKRGSMIEDRIELLNAIGFTWSIRDISLNAAAADGQSIPIRTTYLKQKWQEQYDKLVSFQQQHGHCRVPNRYKSDEFLGSWVKSQREQYKRGSMSQDRIELLNNIGFTWSVRNTSLSTAAALNATAALNNAAVNEQSIHTTNLNQKWHEQYDKLMEFKQQHGHCEVPNRYKSDEFLGWWVKTQREQYKSGEMENGRKDLLNSIGFEWSVQADPIEIRHQKWQEQYDKLVTFQQENGHCRVPCRYKSDSYLGKWVKLQRELYKRGTMKEDWINLLNAIGFAWSVRDTHPGQKLLADQGLHEHL
ncbi:hypothetical protein ACHAXN_012150 [Cyclotella atomus]